MNSKYYYVNRQLFKSHFTLEHLLTLCQEIIEEQQQIIIDEEIANVLVNIIEAFVENDINIIALLMNFVLVIHPLIKTYVTYNKAHFYFITKPFSYYQTRNKSKKEDLLRQIYKDQNSKFLKRQRSSTVHNEILVDTSSIRKSHSFTDLSAPIATKGNDGENLNHRREYYIDTSDTPRTTNFVNESNLLGIKDCPHNVDYLSTGILRLLANIAVTTSDRLMMQLIDHVFRLNILIVLLLDASMAKRVQCLRLLDVILKRMDKDKVQNTVLRVDLHTMLANQIYHQLDGRDNEKELVEICVSIALQRPIQFDMKL
ncbi:unnamed protein product, partial [Rotaria socialis]